jgi:hypothetical protein
MTEGCAPVRLPVTPKPLRTELFSSWWLRVAAANFVSARELLCGFHSRHPDVPLPSSLDSCLDPAFLKAIAHFCRAPIAALQSLDLVQRLPHSQHALLLRFGSASPSCHRHCDRVSDMRSALSALLNTPSYMCRGTGALPASFAVPSMAPLLSLAVTPAASPIQSAWLCHPRMLAGLAELI